MQRVNVSAGQALCRYCGANFPTHRLAAHVAKQHPRPKPASLSPTLVRKRPVDAGR